MIYTANARGSADRCIPMFRESSAGAPQMGSFLPFARLRCTRSHILVQGSKVDAVPILDLKGKDCASRQFSPDFKQSPVGNEMSIKIRGCFPSHKAGHSHVGPAASKLREWFAVQATRPQLHSMHLNAISGGLEHGFNMGCHPSRWRTHIFHAEMTPLEATPQQFIPFQD